MTTTPFAPPEHVDLLITEDYRIGVPIEDYEAIYRESDMLNDLLKKAEDSRQRWVLAAFFFMVLASGMAAGWLWVGLR
jgi:hypothetical protein